MRFRQTFLENQHRQADDLKFEIILTGTTPLSDFGNLEGSGEPDKLERKVVEGILQDTCLF